VVQPALVERIDQGLEHVLLPDHFGEKAGPPLAGKHLIAHGNLRLWQWLGQDRRPL
jgi:hypothetical protein